MLVRAPLASAAGASLSMSEACVGGGRGGADPAEEEPLLATLGRFLALEDCDEGLSSLAGALDRPLADDPMDDAMRLISSYRDCRGPPSSSASPTSLAVVGVERRQQGQGNGAGGHR